MNAARLIAHYERISDAPDAVGRLRRFILDLAVRGKLVQGQPGDEPAAELLKGIAKEKARLCIKNVTAPLGAEEIPFALPVGWSWSRIGEICTKTGSGSTPRGGKDAYKKSGIPFLRSQNVHDDGIRLGDVAFIDPHTHSRMSGTKVLPGDILLNITGGSMGRCSRVPDDFVDANISQHVAIIRVAVSGIQDFLHCLIMSPYFQAFVFDEQTGAGRGGLPKNKMDQIVVALPPLAEQRRIVAKINELMALCDRLEAAQTKEKDARSRLIESGLARLSASDSNTFQNDVRFVLSSLPKFTALPVQIKQIRRTILNLAMRGKLASQNPNDEPASELLNRIATERAELVRKKEIRCEKPLNPIQTTETPFRVPGRWVWSRIGNAVLFTQYGPGGHPTSSTCGHLKLLHP